MTKRVTSIFREPTLIIFRKSKKDKWQWTINSYSFDDKLQCKISRNEILHEEAAEAARLYSRTSPMTDIPYWYYKYNSNCFDRLNDCIEDARKNIKDGSIFIKGLIKDPKYPFGDLYVHEFIEH